MSFHRVGLLLFAAACAVAASGCLGQPSYRVEPVYTRPELKSCQRMAVTGLSGEMEQILMGTYARTFRDQAIVFVERERVKDLFAEKDLLTGDIDSDTREQIKKLGAVQGIIFGYYKETRQDDQKVETLRLRILDVESGDIVGSAIVHAKSKEGANAAGMTQRAAEALRNHLLGISRKPQRPGMRNTRRYGMQ